MTNFTKFAPTYANQGDKDEKELQDPINANLYNKKNPKNDHEFHITSSPPN